MRYHPDDDQKKIDHIQHAKTDFTKVLSADPGHVTARGSYGILLAKSNEPDQALEHLDLALGMRPRSYRYIN